MQSRFKKSLLFLFLISFGNSIFGLNTAHITKEKASWNFLDMFSAQQKKRINNFTIYASDGIEFDASALMRVSQFWRTVNGPKKGEANKQIQVPFNSATMSTVLYWAKDRPIYEFLTPELLPDLLDYVDVTDDLDVIVSLVLSIENWTMAISNAVLIENNYRRIEKFLIKNLEQKTSASLMKLNIKQPSQLIAFLVAHHQIFFENASLSVQHNCDELNRETQDRFIWHAFSKNPRIDSRKFSEKPEWCESDWQEAGHAMRDALYNFSRFHKSGKVFAIKNTVKKALEKLQPANADEAHNAIRKLFFLSLLVLMAQDEFQETFEKTCYEELPRMDKSICASKENIMDLINSTGKKTSSLNPHLISIKNLVDAICKTE